MYTSRRYIEALLNYETKPCDKKDLFLLCLSFFLFSFFSELVLTLYLLYIFISVLLFFNAYPLHKDFSLYPIYYFSTHFFPTAQQTFQLWAFSSCRLILKAKGFFQLHLCTFFLSLQLFLFWIFVGVSCIPHSITLLPFISSVTLSSSSALRITGTMFGNHPVI